MHAGRDHVLLGFGGCLKGRSRAPDLVESEIERAARPGRSPMRGTREREGWAGSAGGGVGDEAAVTHQVSLGQVRS